MPRSCSHKDEIYYDGDGQLASLFNDTWFSRHVLHSHYASSFTSCSQEEWERWATGKLNTFAPLLEVKRNIWGKQEAEKEAFRRGYQNGFHLRYVTRDFLLLDWDFSEAHWTTWHIRAAESPDLWQRLFEVVSGKGPAFWKNAMGAKLFQIATTGTRHEITAGDLAPAWVLKFRDLPCLQDTRGVPRKPAELLRRTSETESLIDVEEFIHSRLDTERNRPLLIALGVSSTPTGPDRILNCLRSLSQAKEPPTSEVDKWYRRLDSMLDACSTGTYQAIKAAFAQERIVLANDGAWTAAVGVFLSGDEDDVPGASLIRPSVAELALWRKVGVAERPTADLAITWLSTLASGSLLSGADIRRVRAILGRHPTRVWNECGHWLNLAGEWKPIGDFSYALLKSPSVPWAHLFDPIKQDTADLRQLSSDIAGAAPFASLPRLSACIENRFLHVTIGTPQQKPWLTQLGIELRRIVLTDEAEMPRIRALAQVLAQTHWQTTSRLETVPYIDGVPAGTKRPAEAVWHDGILYVGENEPTAKLARLVSAELGRAFDNDEISEAIKFCVERAPDFVTSYMEENFNLVPLSVVGPVGMEDILSGSPAPGSSRDDRQSSLDDAGTRCDENVVDNGSGSPDPDQNGGGGAIDRRDEYDDGAALDGGPNEQGPDGPATGDHDPATGSGKDRDERLKQPKPRAPSGPPLIARFAQRLGYSQNGDGAFRHPDGSTIRKTVDDRFPWELRSSRGEIVRWLWPDDHCIVRESLNLEADVWEMLDQSPDSYSMILSTPEGVPAEYSGKRLRMMREAGHLKLYPAAYRLVCESSDDAL